MTCSAWVPPTLFSQNLPTGERGIYREPLIMLRSFLLWVQFLESLRKFVMTNHFKGTRVMCQEADYTFQMQIPKKTNGLIFGKFAPLTLGHIELINQALKQCDHLYLFLSFDQKFLNSQPEWLQAKLGLVDRLRDLKDVVAYSNTSDIITVSYVDESNIPDYPEGANAYEGLIRAGLPKGVVLHKAFSSEKEYDSYFSVHFPECEHVIIDADRNTVPISATKIRGDVFNNFNMLAPPAKKRFVKKVAIVGVESTGKTTLTQLLAEHFSARYTSEIGRAICEEDFYGSEFLMHREDYLSIAMDHRQVENYHAKLSDVGVTFSDTTNLITHFSAVCSYRTDLLDPLFLALDQEEGDNFYDLVLYLQPDVPWVADPLRLQNTPEKRKETNELLDAMISKSYSGTQVVKIDGDNYNVRTAKAIQIVEDFLAGKILEV